MAAIKVGIVEDDMLIAQGIELALNQLGYETLEPVVSYTEAIDLLDRGQPDVLLLDIQLSGRKDGIDLAWKVKEDYHIPFIFLTANSDAATIDRVKKLAPPAFLIKPFRKDELYAAIEICLHNYSGETRAHHAGEGYLINDSLFIKQRQSFIKVRLDDIYYLESDNVYVNVHTAQGKFLVRSTLSNYIELLSPARFLRIHRSYAVHAGHIAAVNAETLTVQGRELPIGRVYREKLLGGLRLG